MTRLHDDCSLGVEEFVQDACLDFYEAFSYHLPFGVKKAYREEIDRLNKERLAYLIKICGFLMQTKVYLFWCKN
jgi:hypothetical protein